MIGIKRTSAREIGIRRSDDKVPVPLMHETRVGHTNYMTKEQWEAKKISYIWLDEGDE